MRAPAWPRSIEQSRARLDQHRVVGIEQHRLVEDAARRIALTAHGRRRVVAVRPGALLLSLARQAAVEPLPAEPEQLRPLATAALGGRCQWLVTLPVYSSTLRGAAGTRMLGVSDAAVRKYNAMVQRGDLHEGHLRLSPPPSTPCAASR